MGWPTSYGYINMTPSIAPSTESSRWLQAPLLVPAKRRLSLEEADKTMSLCSSARGTKLKLVRYNSCSSMISRSLAQRLSSNTFLHARSFLSTSSSVTRGLADKKLSSGLLFLQARPLEMQQLNAEQQSYALLDTSQTSPPSCAFTRHSC
ncbi:hypothetical protein F2Q69_00002263 [Brassica cretica]|uniref:Uncharacterized protein n=1 Tax=Brassica cretica TaxID=69181 RepID=A0A8S9NZX8_BRACR|nr:hypothetical protein F2Q69_00002263 [Brassica cretica]